MTLFGRILPNLIHTAHRASTTIFTNSLHGVVNSTNALVPGGSFTMAVRNKIRCYFPRPCEKKRIKRHGWLHRMSTLGGRRILMHRYLKGRHVLSH